MPALEVGEQLTEDSLQLSNDIDSVREMSISRDDVFDEKGFLDENETSERDKTSERRRPG